MKGSIKEAWKKQMRFVVVTFIYMFAQYLLCVEYYMGITPKNLLEGLDLLFAWVFFQGYTNYLVMLLSCTVLRAKYRIIVDVIGLIFNVMYSPIYFFMVTFFSVEGVHNDALYYALPIAYISFAVVYLVKLIRDVTEAKKQKQVIETQDYKTDIV